MLITQWNKMQNYNLYRFSTCSPVILINALKHRVALLLLKVLVASMKSDFLLSFVAFISPGKPSVFLSLPQHSAEHS